MVIRAYKISTNGERSIVELEVSDSWYSEIEESENTYPVETLSETKTGTPAREIKTVSILSGKKAESISAAK